MTRPGASGPLQKSFYRPPTTRSGRRMTPLRRLAYRLIVPLGYGLIRFWWRLCRVVRIEGREHLSAALKEGASLIPVYWHQHQLFCGWFLTQEKRIKPGWLVSPSVDGEI